MTRVDEIDLRGPFTYAEAFALLTAGFWAKAGEAHNHTPDGRHVFEMEAWFREGPDGPEWAELSAEPDVDRGPRRWWLILAAYDPRALLSDELWAKLGPKSKP